MGEVRDTVKGVRGKILWHGYSETHDPYQVIYRDAPPLRSYREMGGMKISCLAAKFSDDYLRFGLRSYYDVYDKVADYLLTPPIERTDSEFEHHYFGYIVSCIGAISLAARASEQEIRYSFNDTMLVACPDKHPIQINNEYWEDRDRLRADYFASLVTT